MHSHYMCNRSKFSLPKFGVDCVTAARARARKSRLAKEFGENRLGSHSTTNNTIINIITRIDVKYDYLSIACFGRAKFVFVQKLFKRLYPPCAHVVKLNRKTNIRLLLLNGRLNLLAIGLLTASLRSSGSEDFGFLPLIAQRSWSRLFISLHRIAR